MKNGNKCRQEGDKTKYFVVKQGEKAGMGDCFLAEGR